MNILEIRVQQQNLQQNYPITLNYYESEKGFLPLIPLDLRESFKRWRTFYIRQDGVRSYIDPAPGSHEELRIEPKNVLHFNSCYETELKEHLNTWLNSKEAELKNIRERIIGEILDWYPRGEVAPLIFNLEEPFNTGNEELLHYPWSDWNFFKEHDRKVEVALRVTGPNRGVLPPPELSKVRILLVVGESDNIDTEADLNVIQDLRKNKEVEVTPLFQPSLEKLCDRLRDKQGYHIFVFSGHSRSDERGNIGWIKLNKKEEPDIGTFNNALEESIKRGLQLAIFNSCDGLGLARQAASLGLPQSIIMRQPVPDKAAAAFLKYFFEAFTENQSLFTSVHTARNRLEHFRRWPGITWLPIICITNAALMNGYPLIWEQYTREEFLLLKLLKKFQYWKLLGQAAAIGSSDWLLIMLIPRFLNVIKIPNFLNFLEKPILPFLGVSWINVALWLLISGCLIFVVSNTNSWEVKKFQLFVTAAIATGITYLILPPSSPFWYSDYSDIGLIWLEVLLLLAIFSGLLTFILLLISEKINAIEILKKFTGFL